MLRESKLTRNNPNPTGPSPTDRERLWSAKLGHPILYAAWLSICRMGGCRRCSSIACATSPGIRETMKSTFAVSASSPMSPHTAAIAPPQGLMRPFLIEPTGT